MTVKINYQGKIIEIECKQPDCPERKCWRPATKALGENKFPRCRTWSYQGCPLEKQLF